MVERGLSQLRGFLRGHVVEVFSVDTTEVAYLRHQGGMLSPTFNELAQRILRWAEREEVSTRPQFVPAGTTLSQTLSLSLSCPNQVVGTECILFQVFDSLHRH